MENTRTCPRCGVEKPLTSEFWQRNRTKADGVQVYCKECKRQINLDRYHSLPKFIATEEPDKTKRCPRCGSDKPLIKKNWTTNNYGWASHCRDCTRTRLRDLKRSNRITVLRHYSNGDPRCSCCGELELVFLAIDHINGGGRKHRKEVGHSGEFYKWFIDKNFPDGFRVLCHNCNMAFGQLGYCPHNPTSNEGPS